MKLTHDTKHNVGYLRLREKSGGLKTICVSSELNVDLLPDGTVYGIEFLNTSGQFGKSLVVDADIGQLTKIRIV